MADNDKYKLVVALAIGAAGGLLLGNYIWGKENKDFKFSKPFFELSKVIELLNNANPDEIDNLKKKVQNILNTIESTYGNSKE